MLTPKIETSELATAIATPVLLSTEMEPGEVWQLDAAVAVYIRQGDFEALVVADTVFTAANTDVCTAVAHGLLTGDGPFRLTTSAADLPLNLLTGTDYWIIKLDADTFKLATTFALALAGTPVDIADAGTGVHTISDTASTKRAPFIASASSGSMYRPAGSTTLLEPGFEQGTRLTVIRAAGDGAVTLTQMRERPEFAGA